MLDEKKLVENFTKVSDIYNALMLLKEEYGVTLSTVDGIKVLGSNKTLTYRSGKDTKPVIEIIYDAMNKIVSIYCRGDKNISIWVRYHRYVELNFNVGESKGQIFVENGKLYYYNGESINTACELLNGLAHVRSPQEFESVCVYPDGLQDISFENPSLGDNVTAATSYALEILSEKTKSPRR